MLFRRVMSELVDLFVTIMGVALAAKITHLGLQLVGARVPDIALIGMGLAVLGMPVLLQSLFWNQGASIGKTFMRLQVVDEETGEPADYTRMITRELMTKWLSVYIAVVPVIFGYKGVHEKVTGTTVISLLERRADKMPEN